MAELLCIQHVAHEGPGLIATKARQRGLELRTYRPYLRERLPPARQVPGLIVMGGPMGVSDVEAHPNLAAEIELIAEMHALGRPLLGICLGAQLMAAALGAAVSRGPAQEIGFGEVSLTAQGRADPVLGGAAESLPVFHWHGDTFELPEGAIHLAESPLYRNQAFRHGEVSYALQFHLELDRQLLAGWHEHLPADVSLDERATERVGAVGDACLGRFFELCRAS